MKKFFLLFVTLFFWGFVSQAQIHEMYLDDFESYTVGDFIAQENPTWWDTWSSLPGSGEDGIISDAQAYSGSNSVLVDETGGATDLIMLLGDKSNGVFEVNWQMYVPGGFAGYYNLQHYQAPGIEWAMEVYFNTDGTAVLKAEGQDIPFNYTHDVWFSVVNHVDMDSDIAQMYIDGVMIHEWQWSTQAGGSAGANQLGGVDFFAGSQGSDVPMYYFDNIEYLQIFEPLYFDDFESYTVGDYIAQENPTWWDTWSSLPGTGEDALISDAQAYSGSNSVLVDETDGATDLIMLLGDKISGVFEVNWYMYIPGGFAGYYNLQHYQAPGIEWAMEVYFNTDGTAVLKAEGQDIPFNYTHDVWFSVVNYVNMDIDTARMFIDGVMIDEWKWSTQSGGSAGANQLGGVDFFAGSQGSDVPLYYFDDVAYLQLGGTTDPAIEITPEELEATLETGQIEEQYLNIANVGAAALDYNLAIVFIQGGTDVSVIPSTGIKNQHISIDQIQANTSQPGGIAPPTEDVTLTYCDVNDGTSIGLTSWPNEWEVAAKYPASMMYPHAGMELTSVMVYINDLLAGDEFKLMIYGMGLDYMPGNLIYEQEFSPLGLSWENIILDTPITVTGEDLWVGYWILQSGETHPAGCGCTPAVYNGDWISTGPGWGHLSNNPDLNYNWNIVATFTGDPWPLWLSAAPTSGTVDPGNSDDITVTFDATGLSDTDGTYDANIVVFSNDPENPSITVPVILHVGTTPPPTQYYLDFEDAEDWDLTFDPWLALDVEGGATYSISGHTFPHQGEAMAYIAFNPATVDPPMTEPEIQPQQGDRFGACLAAIPPPFNDDWMISPQVILGLNSEFTFWVKSYIPDYGLEKYNVGISTTGNNPEDFTLLNAAGYLEAPADAWEQQVWDVSAYDEQTVYLGIQCVSEDAFIFMLDDIRINFNPVGMNELLSDAEFVVYPNPARDYVTIKTNTSIKQIKVYNYVGQIVAEEIVGDEIYTINTAGYNSGIYFIQVETSEGWSTRKVLIE
jgi:hypothetical protein